MSRRNCATGPSRRGYTHAPDEPGGMPRRRLAPTAAQYESQVHRDALAFEARDRGPVGPLTRRQTEPLTREGNGRAS